MKWSTVLFSILISFFLVQGVISNNPIEDPGIVPVSIDGGLDDILGFVSSCPSGGIDGLLTGLVKGLYDILSSLLGSEKIIPFYTVLGKIDIHIDLVEFFKGGPDWRSPYVQDYSKIQIVQIIVEVARICNEGRISTLPALPDTDGEDDLLESILSLLADCGGLDGFITGLTNGLIDLLLSLVGDKMGLLTTSLDKIPSNTDLLIWVGGGPDWTTPFDVPCKCNKLQSLKMIIKITKIFAAGPKGLPIGGIKPLPIGGELDVLIGLLTNAPCGGIDGFIIGLVQGINKLLCTLLGSSEKIVPLLYFFKQMPPGADLYSYLKGKPSWTVPIAGSVTQLQCAYLLAEIARIYPIRISGGGRVVLGDLLGGIFEAVESIWEGIFGLLSDCPSKGIDGLLKELAIGINDILCSLLGSENIVIFYNSLDQLPPGTNVVTTFRCDPDWTTPFDNGLSKLQWWNLLVKLAGTCQQH